MIYPRQRWQIYLTLLFAFGNDAETSNILLEICHLSDCVLKHNR